MIAPDRHRCIAPFCRSTTGKYGPEWICSKHWRMVPKSLKADLSKAYRRYRKAFGNTGFWEYPPGSENRIKAVAADRVWRDSWAKCKEAAIYNSMMAIE